MTTDNEYITKRREKVKLLRELNVDPYTNTFRPSSSVKEIVDKYKGQDNSNFESDNVNYKVAGRVVAIRSFGKSAFIKILDNQIKFQIFISNDSAGKEKMDFFKKFVDIGDFVGIVGPCFFTKTNELSIEAQELIVLTKSLNTLPEKWHGLTNIETRYRQRYVDLISNESVKDVFILRSKIISQIRDFMNSKKFIEVETPLKTHHNTLDMDLILRIAPELYLKRLIIGGIEKVFEIGRNFRNEGISTQHNPEFTMIEFYQAYSDYLEMMNFIEELISDCVSLVSNNQQINYQNKIKG